MNAPSLLRRYGNPSLSGFLSLSLLTPPVATAQGIGFVEKPRLGEKYDRRLDREVREERNRQSREGMSVSVIASLRYDDNIFQTATDPQEDFVTEVAPRLAYTKGQPDGRAWVRVAYEATGVLYLDDRDENRVDQLVTAEARLRRKAFVFAYAGAWAKLGTPTADVGGATERTEWRNRASLAWEPRRKTSAEIFGEWSQVDQRSASLFDIRDHAIGLALRYRYSPKSEVQLAWRTGKVDVEGADSQDVQRVTGQVLWQPRPKVSLNLEAGGEYRDFGSWSDWELVYAARLNWAPRRGTDLYLRSYRRQEASAYFGGQNYMVEGIATGISQRLHGGWTAGLELGRETSDYFDVSGGGFANRDDEINFVRPGLEYRFKDDYELKMFYQWAENDSNYPDFGSSNQEVGVSVNHTF